MGLILPLLRVIPIWAYAVAALVAWGAYGHWKSNRYEKARVEAAAEAQRLTSRIEAKKQADNREVEAGHAKRVKVVTANATSLRNANSELQQLLARKGIDPTDTTTICGADGKRGEALERLLKESAGLVEEGAGRVEFLGAKTASLQDYIRRVCVSK